MAIQDTPKTGYDLAAKILATHPDDPIETMLRCSHGTESDWLEFKAGMTLLPEDEKRGLKPEDLYWTYAKSIVAMVNTSGGAFVIGVDDKTHSPVPLENCDPQHILETGDVDSYIRNQILDHIAPEVSKPQSWTDNKGVKWTVEERLSQYIEPRQVSFCNETVVVLLVKPSDIGKEVLVCRGPTGSGSDLLPYRKSGDVGSVETLSRYAVIKKYPEIRQRDSDRYAHLFLQAAPALFICHSSKDCKAAEQIRQHLEVNGVVCWFAPKNIVGGNQWADSIVDAIGSSTAFLCLISRNSQKSRNVDSEVRLAFTRNKRIIPVRIDRTPLSKSMEYYLAQFQIIEAAGREADAIRDVIAAISCGVPEDPTPNPINQIPLSAASTSVKPGSLRLNSHTPLDKLAQRFREATVPNEAGIPPIVAMTDACPMLNKFIWASGGYFFWETIADSNGWKLQRNKFIKHFRIRDPDKTCRACGWSRRMRMLFFPEVVEKAKRMPKGTSNRVGRIIAFVSAGLIVGGAALCAFLWPKRNCRIVDLGCGQRIRLVRCPAGEFWMGSPAEERGRYSNEVQRLVKIDKFFWAGETEVTQGQWLSLMGGTVQDKAAALEADGFRIYNYETGKALTIREYYNTNVPLVQTCDPYDELSPMYFVSWADALRFCGRLTERERAKGSLPEGYEYRLPTEEEWEYLARAGRASAYPNGMDMEGDGESLEPNLSNIAWFKGNSPMEGKIVPVHKCGQLTKNSWGIYDVSGNVWEWCIDPYEAQDEAGIIKHALRSGSQSPSALWLLHPVAGYLADARSRRAFSREWMKNDIAPMSMKRAIRGGSWNSDARVCRVANRRGFFSPWGRNDIGFRVVLAPVLPKSSFDKTVVQP